MVKRCAYGVCNSDDRYRDRVVGVSFHPFPKPKTNLEKCLRWIKLCNRPHDQLNVNTITRNVYVCSKHFVGGQGPSALYPDPLPHSNDTPRPARQLPKKRKLDFSPKRTTLSEINETQKENVCIASGNTISSSCQTDASDTTQSTLCQTDSSWIDPLDMVGLAADNRVMQREVDNITKEKEELHGKLKLVSKQCDTMYSKLNISKFDKDIQTSSRTTLDVTEVINDEVTFKYYTAFTPDQFLGLYKFIVPDEKNVPFEVPKNRKTSFMELDIMNQLFLIILKLRHNFDHEDLGFRFGLSKQTVSVMFTTWINYMFLRFGEVSIWPHRDLITANMPKKYREEFPTTFAIFDCTEIKICKPSSLKAQSQTYSDYKSTNTLKGLVACDPRGSIIYASMLFSGSISDKEIFVRSGCKKMLGDLVKEGYLQIGDSVMADKGFNVEADLKECGLLLNIPPFARQGMQMSESDVFLTKKIATHRVHVERAIARIKRFKILAGRLPLSLQSCVNQIWYVCAFLTNFLPPCIKDKP